MKHVVKLKGWQQCLQIEQHFFANNLNTIETKSVYGCIYRKQDPHSMIGK